MSNSKSSTCEAPVRPMLTGPSTATPSPACASARVRNTENACRPAPLTARLPEATFAADGFEAGRLTATFRPDVVLLDLRMPGRDGFQVCRTIKADPATSHTLVIAMTGFYSPETEARILECGAVRCFAKPVEPSTLSAFIDSVFEEKSAKSRSRRRGPSRS